MNQELVENLAKASDASAARSILIVVAVSKVDALEALTKFIAAVRAGERFKYGIKEVT